MTWRALLASATKPPPPPAATAPATPQPAAPQTVVPKVAPGSAPPPSKAQSISLGPSVATSAVPAIPTSSATNVAPKLESPVAQSSSSSSGFFELPPSPGRRHARDETNREGATATTTEPPQPSPPKIHPDSPEARWEPPISGFLSHQNQKNNNNNSLKPISTWFLDDAYTQQQQQIPKATSPVKAGFLPDLSLVQPSDQQQHHHHHRQRHHQQQQPSSVDLRKARILFSQDFIEGIEQLEEERKKVDSFYYDASKNLTPTASNNHNNKNNKNNRNQNIHVFVSKRPMVTSSITNRSGSSRSNSEGDFDVVRVESEEDSSSPSVIVYKTEIKYDLRKKEVRPVIIGPFASCFGGGDHYQSPYNNNQNEVYQRAAKSLVETSKSGGLSTLLMFGQSGSGKSYTMSAIEGCAARDLFTCLPQTSTVRLNMLQLQGSKCYDLLDETPSHVRVVDTHGGVRFVNALSKKVSAPEELLENIIKAKKRRSAGFVHVICRITVVPPPDAPAFLKSGTLTLIDCAGTEQRHECQMEDPNQRAAIAEINASLYILKVCLRAKTAETFNNNQAQQHQQQTPSSVAASQQQVPYSHSTLTRILRESLSTEDATFHVIATISPKATDTEETLETLSTVSNVIGGFEEELSIATNHLQTSQNGVATGTSAEDDPLPKRPNSWDRSKLCEWLLRKHLIKDEAQVPTNLTGRKVMKMTKFDLQNIFYNQESQKSDHLNGDFLYRLLRAESDRVARLELKRSMALDRARKERQLSERSRFFS